MNARAPRSKCPISCSLELFGDRWTLLVLRDLLFLGKQRFREFLDSPEGIASNILTDRLRRLERAGLIERTPDQNDKRRNLYAATPSGRDLAPILTEIANWGAVHTNSASPEDVAEILSGDDGASMRRKLADKLHSAGDADTQ